MPVDLYGRPLRSLRLSVTDRCNLRCQYCMPEPEYVWLPREDLLTFEEISSLVDIFLSMGVDKVRLTGGEPLLRRDLPALVERLARKPALQDLAITTNGLLLADQAQALRDAGLHRVTVSLDTLRRDRFVELTRMDRHADTLAGIAAAARVFGGLKLDSVVIRGVNDDELAPLIEFGKTMNAEVRFIEYMDVAGATRWTTEDVISRDEMIRRLEAHYGGSIETLPREDAAPASRYRLPNGTLFGIIASTTQPFCGTCDRSRLTADGLLYTCLYGTNGVDLRAPLRAWLRAADAEAAARAGVDAGAGAGAAASADIAAAATADVVAAATDDAVREAIDSTWRTRRDRGAEERLALPERAAFIPVAALKRDAHLEMHTKGG
jgi:cyclic pyranopterin phosphate synthase